MPTAQRRHPLFLALMKPQPPIYPDAVTAVAWDDDMPVEGGDGVVYLVSRQCAQMRTWARKLQELHRLDNTHKVEEGISSLSLSPLLLSSMQS